MMAESRRGAIGFFGHPTSHAFRIVKLDQTTITKTLRPSGKRHSISVAQDHLSGMRVNSLHECLQEGLKL
jgi:hypothetical protein